MTKCKRTTEQQMYKQWPNVTEQQDKQWPNVKEQQDKQWPNVKEQQKTMTKCKRTKTNNDQM